MLVRFRQDVIDLHPKVVVILAGTNDIAGNTGPMRNEDIEANFASFTELARANGIRVVYSSVLPVHNYTDRSKDFFAQRPQTRVLELNTWLKDYCARNNIVYLDYFSALVDDKGLLKKDLAERRPASERRRIQDHGSAGRGGYTERLHEQTTGWNRYEDFLITSRRVRAHRRAEVATGLRAPTCAFGEARRWSSQGKVFAGCGAYLTLRDTGSKVVGIAVNVCWSRPLLSGFGYTLPEVHSRARWRCSSSL